MTIAPYPNQKVVNYILQTHADNLRLLHTEGFHLLLALAWEALKTGKVWPHTKIAYGRPRLNLDDPDPKKRERNRAIYKHLVAIAGHRQDVAALIIYDRKGRWIPSGWEMYERVYKRLHYYIKKRDHQIFAQNMQAYACIDGANLFEACVGDGKKLAAFLKKLEKEGVCPKKIYINDINEGLLIKAEKILSQYAEVARVPGDIVQTEFWRDPVFAELRQAQSPTVFAMHGATFNNFDNQGEILNHINRSFKTGTHLLISVDCTMDPDMLVAAYNCVEMAQWEVIELVYLLEQVGFKIEPEHLTATIAPKPQAESDRISLQFSFTLHKEYCFPISFAEEHEVLVLRKGVIQSDEISKIHEDTIAAKFAKARIDITHRLRRDGKPLRRGAHVKDKTNMIIFSARTQGYKPRGDLCPDSSSPLQDTKISSPKKRPSAQTRHNRAAMARERDKASIPHFQPMHPMRQLQSESVISAPAC